jgi:hypothetical protein
VGYVESADLAVSSDPGVKLTLAHQNLALGAIVRDRMVRIGEPIA